MIVAAQSLDAGVGRRKTVRLCDCTAPRGLGGDVVDAGPTFATARHERIRMNRMRQLVADLISNNHDGHAATAVADQYKAFEFFGPHHVHDIDFVRLQRDRARQEGTALAGASKRDGNASVPG